MILDFLFLLKKDLRMNNFEQNKSEFIVLEDFLFQKMVSKQFVHPI